MYIARVEIENFKNAPSETGLDRKLFACFPCPRDFLRFWKGRKKFLQTLPLGVLPKMSILGGGRAHALASTLRAVRDFSPRMAFSMKMVSEPEVVILAALRIPYVLAQETRIMRIFQNGFFLQRRRCEKKAAHELACTLRNLMPLFCSGCPGAVRSPVRPPAIFPSFCSSVRAPLHRGVVSARPFSVRKSTGSPRAAFLGISLISLKM